MKEDPLNPLLVQISDGYIGWHERDRCRRSRHNKAIVAVSLSLAIVVTASALNLESRYNSYTGSYAPRVVPVVDRMLFQQ